MSTPWTNGSTSKKKSRKKEHKDLPDLLNDLSNDKLQQLLDEALTQEDYEKAAKIRDEMNNKIHALEIEIN